MNFENLNPQQRDLQVVNYLKGLVIDGVDRAASGHPGGAMSSMDFAYLLFSEFLHHHPQDTHYFARDRFVLSAGHESMMLYSLLYASGILSAQDLKNFRQLDSRTPGHPENHLCPAVECTTGPLGQGAAMSVGFAIAGLHLAARLDQELFHTRTWCLLGDGCMQEEVTLGAASYAGHLGLGNLIWFYDKNRAQISGTIERVTSDQQRPIFEGMGWHVIELTDGHNHADLREAMQQAQHNTQQPTLIVALTQMAHGAASLEGSYKTHGSPFSAAERDATKKRLGIPQEQGSFYFPRSALDHFRRNFADLTKSAEQRQQRLTQRINHDPAFRKLYHSFFQPKYKNLPSPSWPSEPQATRLAFGTLLSLWSSHLPHLVGGSADLEPSNMTTDFAHQVQDFSRNSRQGRNFAYGVREFTMACISNALALYGGLLPFDATFLAFSDYMRPALRLGSLQRAQVIHEFTHDSFYVGEDGPTHQPVEQLMSLRLIPDLYVMRPADGAELEALMRVAFKLPHPSCFILSRQKIPPLSALQSTLPSDYGEGAVRGGWVVKESARESKAAEKAGKANQRENAHVDYVFYATGSEVSLALEVAHKLEDTQPGINVKVVSLPCWRLLEQQPPSYQEAVLSPQCPRKISLEAGSTLGWQKFIGSQGLALGLDHFGASAPADDLADKLGFSCQQVLKRVLHHDFTGSTSSHSTA